MDRCWSRPSSTGQVSVLYATKSALTLDFMPIMGIALFYGLVFSVINILVDVTYGALDPRVSRA